MFAAVWWRGEFVGVVVAGEDWLAAEPGGVDFAAEGFAEVGGDLVAVVEHVGGEGEDGVGVEGYEVGVLAGFDGADVGGEAGETCGRGGGPVGELREGEFAAGALGPENGEGGGERGDAAPGEVEAAGLLRRVAWAVEALHVRRAGGVVGGDEVDGAVDEGLPELFAVGGAADGGRGLAEGGAVGIVLDGFGGEVEEVRAGFDGDGKAFALGCVR